MKKFLISGLGLGMVFALIMAGNFLFKGESYDQTYTLEQVMAATTDKNYEDITKSPEIRGSARLEDYRFNILLSSTISGNFAAPGHTKRYANFVDINGDGLADFLFGEAIYDSQNVSSSQLVAYRLALLLNIGDGKFVNDYNCTYTQDEYFGKCVDPAYIK